MGLVLGAGGVVADRRARVDGGVCSLSNLGLVAGRGLGLIVCLNPISSLVEAIGGTPDGLNLMARGRRVEVLEPARRTTAFGPRALRCSDQVVPPRTRRARPARRRPQRRAA